MQGRMPQLEAHKYPVLQHRAQGVLAFAQGGPKGHHAGTRGNAPSVTAIVELVVCCVAQRRVHVGAQDKAHVVLCMHGILPIQATWMAP
jgi:hypothetical protein